MAVGELVLWGVVGWTAIGLVGSWISGRRRGNWPKARRGLMTVVVVWAVYLLVLVLVSVRTPRRSLAPGQPQCFGELCFAVEGTDQMAAFAGRGQKGDRLLRVRIRVSNRGKSGPTQDAGIRAYLLDGRGGRWWPVRGLLGVPLQTPVPAGGQLLSEPVFAVPSSVGPVTLVLTHGHWQPGALVVGDADSLLHRPVVMQLGTP